MKDFLDEMIEEETERNPEFPALLDEAIKRRDVARMLATKRQAAGKTQTEMARALGTSQSQIARIEGAAGDVEVSTLTRFAAALGFELDIKLKPIQAVTKKRRPAKRKPLRSGRRIAPAMRSKR